MDARTLSNKVNFLTMEIDARKILINEKLAEVEEVAMMTRLDVCEKLLEFYEVVSCEDDEITIVKKENIKAYYDIVRTLRR